MLDLWGKRFAPEGGVQRADVQAGLGQQLLELVVLGLEFTQSPAGGRAFICLRHEGPGRSEGPIQAPYCIQPTAGAEQSMDS
ncbi:hypothetical protein FHT32_003317 [Variovorax sp. SG517]|nr:hypothetical protein [Variovorax sp. SG517]